MYERLNIHLKRKNAKFFNLNYMIFLNVQFFLTIILFNLNHNSLFYSNFKN